MVHIECSHCTSTLDKFGKPKYSKGCKRCEKGRPVEVAQVKMLWAEGYERDMKTFKGVKPMYLYQNELKEINDENKKGRTHGTYTKTKVEIKYMDGTKKEYRVDLGANDYDPDSGEFVGDYIKQRQKLGRMVGKKWVYYDPPRYTKSDTGLEIYNGYADGLRKNKKGFYVLEAPGVRKEKELSRKTTIVPSGTGFECKPPCGSCGTNKCKSYKEWNDKRIKQNIKDFETYGAKGKASRGKQQRDPEHWDKLHKKMNPNRGDPQYEDEGRVLGSYSSKGHRPQKSKPWTSKKGPGSGWHGQIARHRMAALKGRRRMG